MWRLLVALFCGSWPPDSSLDARVTVWAQKQCVVALRGLCCLAPVGASLFKGLLSVLQRLAVGPSVIHCCLRNAAKASSSAWPGRLSHAAWQGLWLWQEEQGPKVRSGATLPRSLARHPFFHATTRHQHPLRSMASPSAHPSDFNIHLIPALSAHPSASGCAPLPNSLPPISCQHCSCPFSTNDLFHWVFNCHL